MNILVCVKQVPNTAEIKICPETNNLLRAGVASIVNPYDLYALEMAVRLKDDCPAAKITVISMGPAQAESALRHCLAVGADEAFLLSDNRFAGADTLATSYVLAKAAAKLGPFDLIFCGKQAIDGDTAQTGPQLAERLNCPQMTLVREVELRGDSIRATRETRRGTEVWEAELPVVITITKPAFEPRSAPLGAKLAAKRAEITVLSLETIGAESEQCGLRGSATVVRRVYTPKAKKKCAFVDVDALAGMLQQRSTPKQKHEQALQVCASYNTADVWVWVESLNETALLCEGRRLAEKMQMGLTAIVFGHRIDSAVRSLQGADRVIYVDEPAFAQYNAETHTAALQQLAEKYQPDTMLFPASCNGRDLAPRLACRLQMGLTADCIDLDFDRQTGHVQWVRPAFCGKLMAVIECPSTRPQMGTVRVTGNKRPAACETKLMRERIYSSASTTSPQAAPRARMIERQDEPGGDSLASAEVIVAGGRGIGSAEGFSLLRELADVLGGSVAGSRVAADEGWVPRSLQVGQTGAMVCPRVYVACGISGASQHLAGMSGAELVIAINSDPEAAIFGAADFGIVGDAKKVLPALTKLLQPVE